MRILCIIPALNERGNLEPLSRELVNAFRKARISFGILFVLQGSDGSLDVINQIRKTYPEIQSLYFVNALGIGFAYKKGFQKVSSKFSHILTLDADLNHNPKDLLKFLHVWKTDQPDIIVGSRFVRGGKFNEQRIWKRYLSMMVNRIVTTLLQIPIHDVTSGYRLIKREVIEKVRHNLRERNYPSYMELILLAKKNGFTFSEVSITYTPRKWGKSKMGKMRTLFDYLAFLPKAFTSF